MYRPGNRPNQDDAFVSLQTVGPTAQDAAVIPVEDKNDYTDIFKANLPPKGHAAKGLHKLHTLTKTRRVQASSPFLQKPDLNIASNKVIPSPSYVTQARVLT